MYYNIQEPHNENHTSANLMLYKVGIWLCYHESLKYSYFSEGNVIQTSNSLKVLGLYWHIIVVVCEIIKQGQD